MKRFLKIITVILTAALLISGLTSCSGGFTSTEANTMIEDFLSKISAEDYEGAKALVHPSYKEDLESYIKICEKAGGFDCSDGFEIQEYTNTSYSKNNEAVGGAAYSTTFNAALGFKLVKVTVEIVKNDAGYGIYTFNIEAIKS